MDQDQLEQVLREALHAEDRPGADLSDETLMSLQSHRLSTDDRERLIDAHIGSDVDIRKLLDAAMFPDHQAPGAEPDTLEESADTDEAWQQFVGKLTHNAEQQPGSMSQRVRRRPTTRSLATAALWLVTGGLLGFFTASLQPSDEMPTANARLVELRPVAEQADRRGNPMLDQEDTTDGLVLVLTLADPLSAANYRLTIHDPRGGVLWSTETLEPGPEGFFLVHLPPRELSIGRHQISIFDSSGAVPYALAEYELVVQ